MGEVWWQWAEEGDILSAGTIQKLGAAVCGNAGMDLRGAGATPEVLEIRKLGRYCRLPRG